MMHHLFSILGLAVCIVAAQEQNYSLGTQINGCSSIYIDPNIDYYIDHYICPESNKKFTLKTADVGLKQSDLLLAIECEPNTKWSDLAAIEFPPERFNPISRLHLIKCPTITLNILESLKTKLRTNSFQELYIENTTIQFDSQVDYIEHLSMHDNNLFHSAKESIKKITSLKVLNLRNESITQIERGVFGNLTLLEKLSLQRNKIEKLDDGALSDLGNLKILDLSFNKISEIPHDFFENNLQLHSLGLGYNKIEDIKRFQGLEKLRKLNLNGNSLRSIEPEAFNGLKELQVIGFHDVQLQPDFDMEILYESLRNCQNLKKVVWYSRNGVQFDKSKISENVTLTGLSDILSVIYTGVF